MVRSGPCVSCGEADHASSRSPACPNHRPTIKEKTRELLGENPQTYTRVLPFDSIVREPYREEFRDGVIRISSFLRNVVCRAQVFVNGYIIDHSEDTIPTYIFSETFWYSICQLVQGKTITNTNSNFPTSVLQSWDVFKSANPEAVFRPEEGIKGYSDALAAACRTLRDTYTTHIVANFEGRLIHYCRFRLSRSVPVTLLLTIDTLPY